MPWYNSLGIINEGQAKQQQLDMLNQAKMQEIEQQKQAIAAGLQSMFPGQQVPYQLSGSEVFDQNDPILQMQQYNPMAMVQNLPGLMPEQANAIAGAIQASPQMGQALLGQLFPQQQELTNDIKGYQQAMGMGLIPQDMDYTKYLATVKQPLVSVGGQLPYKIPENYTLKDPSNPMAGVVPIPGSSADPNSPNHRKNTDAELASAGYANMMSVAENGINTVYKGFSPTNIRDTLLDKAVGVSANFAVSPEYQGYMQLANAWIRAKLRRESGATIAKDEWAKEYETFFPIAGDTQNTIEQKARLRAEAIKNMNVMSQGAYEKFYSSPSSKKPKTSKPETAATAPTKAGMSRLEELRRKQGGQ